MTSQAADSKGEMKETRQGSSASKLARNMAASTRRRLVARRRSTYNKELFKAEIFYLDVKGYKDAAKLETDVIRLGARVEKFLSKEVTRVITNRSDSSSSVGSGNAGDPSTSTAGTSGKSSPLMLSRGRALLSKATATQTAQSEGSSDVLAIAKQWGIQTWPLAKILRAIKDEGTPPSRTSPLNKRPKILQVRHLNGSFLKVEDASGNYRPLHGTFKTFPRVNIGQARQSAGSPFLTINKKSTLNKVGKSPLVSGNKDSKVSTTLNASAVKPSSKLPVPKTDLTSTADTANDSKPAISTPNESVPGDGQGADCKDKKPTPPKLAGYCECCEVWYQDLREHINTESHKRFAEKDSNFSVVDSTISQLPSIGALVTSSCEAGGPVAAGRRDEPVSIDPGHKSDSQDGQPATNGPNIPTGTRINNPDPNVIDESPAPAAAAAASQPEGVSVPTSEGKDESNTAQVQKSDTNASPSEAKDPLSAESECKDPKRDISNMIDTADTSLSNKQSKVNKEDVCDSEVKVEACVSPIDKHAGSDKTETRSANQEGSPEQTVDTTENSTEASGDVDDDKSNDKSVAKTNAGPSCALESAEAVTSIAPECAKADATPVATGSESIQSVPCDTQPKATTAGQEQNNKPENEKVSDNVDKPPADTLPNTNETGDADTKLKEGKKCHSGHVSETSNVTNGSEVKVGELPAMAVSGAGPVQLSSGQSTVETMGSYDALSVPPSAAPCAKSQFDTEAFADIAELCENQAALSGPPCHSPTPEMMQLPHLNEDHTDFLNGVKLDDLELPDIDMIENMDCDDIMDDEALGSAPGGSLLDVLDFTPTKQNMHKNDLIELNTIGDPIDIENVLSQQKDTTSFTADFSDMSDDEEDNQVKLPWQQIMNSLEDDSSNLERPTTSKSGGISVPLTFNTTKNSSVPQPIAALTKEFEAIQSAVAKGGGNIVPGIATIKQEIKQTEQSAKNQNVNASKSARSALFGDSVCSIGDLISTLSADKSKDGERDIKKASDIKANVGTIIQKNSISSVNLKKNTVKSNVKSDVKSPEKNPTKTDVKLESKSSVKATLATESGNKSVNVLQNAPNTALKRKRDDESPPRVNKISKTSSGSAGSNKQKRSGTFLTKLGENVSFRSKDSGVSKKTVGVAVAGRPSSTPGPPGAALPNTTAPAGQVGQMHSHKTHQVVAKEQTSPGVNNRQKSPDIKKASPHNQLRPSPVSNLSPSAKSKMCREKLLTSTTHAKITQSSSASPAGTKSKCLATGSNAAQPSKSHSSKHDFKTASAGNFAERLAQACNSRAKQRYPVTATEHAAKITSLGANKSKSTISSKSPVSKDKLPPKSSTHTKTTHSPSSTSPKSRVLIAKSPVSKVKETTVIKLPVGPPLTTAIISHTSSVSLPSAAPISCHTAKSHATVVPVSRTLNTMTSSRPPASSPSLVSQSVPQNTSYSLTSAASHIMPGVTSCQAAVHSALSTTNACMASRASSITVTTSTVGHSTVTQSHQGILQTPPLTPTEHAVLTQPFTSCNSGLPRGAPLTPTTSPVPNHPLVAHTGSPVTYGNMKNPSLTIPASPVSAHPMVSPGMFAPPLTARSACPVVNPAESMTTSKPGVLPSISPRDSMPYIPGTASMVSMHPAHNSRTSMPSCAEAMNGSPFVVTPLNTHISHSSSMRPHPSLDSGARPPGLDPSLVRVKQEFPSQDTHNVHGQGFQSGFAQVYESLSRDCHPPNHMPMERTYNPLRAPHNQPEHGLPSNFPTALPPHMQSEYFGGANVMPEVNPVMGYDNYQSCSSPVPVVIAPRATPSPSCVGARSTYDTSPCEGAAQTYQYGDKTLMGRNKVPGDISSGDLDRPLVCDRDGAKLEESSSGYKPDVSRTPVSDPSSDPACMDFTPNSDRTCSPRDRPDLLKHDDNANSDMWSTGVKSVDSGCPSSVESSVREPCTDGEGRDVVRGALQETTEAFTPFNRAEPSSEPGTHFDIAGAKSSVPHGSTPAALGGLPADLSFQQGPFRGPQEVVGRVSPGSETTDSGTWEQPPGQGDKSLGPEQADLEDSCSNLSTFSTVSGDPAPGKERKLHKHRKSRPSHRKTKHTLSEAGSTGVIADPPGDLQEQSKWKAAPTDGLKTKIVLVNNSSDMISRTSPKHVTFSPPSTSTDGSSPCEGPRSKWAAAPSNGLKLKLSRVMATPPSDSKSSEDEGIQWSIQRSGACKLVLSTARMDDLPSPGTQGVKRKRSRRKLAL